MTDVIYLAPLCQEHERMWCEHDAPVDCECIDGPHPWIKYVAALRQPTQSDVSFRELAAVLYRKSAEFQVGLTVDDSYTLAAEAIAFLQEQSK